MRFNLNDFQMDRKLKSRSAKNAFELHNYYYLYLQNQL